MHAILVSVYARSFERLFVIALVTIFAEADFCHRCFADPLLAGQRVVVIKSTADLNVGGKKVGYAEVGDEFAVGKVSGKWLWIPSREGYLKQSDVVSVENAKDYFDKKVRNAPVARNYAKRSLFLEKQNQLDHAIRDCDSAIRLDPEVSVFYIVRARIWNKKNNSDKAIEDCDKALAIEPDNADAYSTRGVAKFLLKDFNAALVDFDESIRLYPTHYLYFAHRGTCYQTLGNLPKAIADFDQAIRLMPNIALGWLSRGAALVVQGEVERAVSDLDRAIQLDSNDANGLILRGEAYWRWGKQEQALKDLNKGLEILPESNATLDLRKRTHALRGQIYLGMKKLDEAMADANESIRIQPDLVDAFRIRATVWIMKRNATKALIDLDKAIELAPQATILAPLYLTRGHLYQAMDQPAEAVANFTKVIELDDSSAEAHRLLASVLATAADETVRDGKKAVQVATKACELTEWKRADCLETLAAACAEAGDFSKAIQWQEKALQLVKKEDSDALTKRLALYQEGRPYHTPVKTEATTLPVVEKKQILDPTPQTGPSVVGGTPKARFASLHRRWKQIDAEINQLIQKFVKASAEQKPALVTQYKKLQSDAVQLRIDLEVAALQAYVTDSKDDQTVIDTLVGFSAFHLYSDDADAAYVIAELLLRDHKDIDGLHAIAGEAAFVRHKFHVAERLFDLAAKRSPLSGQVAHYHKNIEQHQEHWTAESIKLRDGTFDKDLPLIRLETNKGVVVLELFENEAPQTVANFIHLVEKGFYDGLTFHRVLARFMAQTGCPLGDGTGGPGYNIPCESYKKEFRRHFTGSLSMAHAGRDTGGSQFFITLRPTPHLDGKHTVFGRVIQGMKVVQRLQRIDPKASSNVTADQIIQAKVIRKRDHTYQPTKVTKRKKQASKVNNNNESEKSSADSSVAP